MCDEIGILQPMNLHLDQHHTALNALLGILRERGGFALAGQFMQLHPRNEWQAMRDLAATLEASHPDIDVRDQASELITALDEGPLQAGWTSPESSSGGGQ